jgi:diguanylate cyclase (GGDEF)-like protein/PAS domain S-box-containing protein
LETVSDSLTFLLILATAATVAAGVMAARRWEAAAAPAVVVCMAAATWWTMNYALLLKGTPPSTRFWMTFTFVGVVLTPPAFLVFALLFTERRAWLTRKTLALLAIQPLVVLPILFTDSYHGLFFGDFGFQADEPFHGGPVFWLNVLYSYLIEILAFVLLLGAYIRSSSIQRRQTGLLLAGALAPTALNILSLALLTPQTNVDATPIGFAFTGLAMVYHLRTHGLFDLVPVARHEVVNRMSDGVLVLDAEGRLVDVNPAAIRLLAFRDMTLVGRHLDETLADPALAARLLALAPESPRELDQAGTAGHILDVRVAEMRTEKTRRPARLVVLRDITDLKRTEQALKRQLAENETLQQRLRQEAIRDALTGLYNRRFLEETLALEVARAERSGHGLTVAMLDIDHFKQFNDRYGHAHGDQVLRALGYVLQDHARAGDAACRYGGEEFVMVLPEASPDGAVQRLDELRREFAALDLQCGADTVHATFSAGIAGYPHHGMDADALIQAADRALYTAKRSGRNRVCIARERDVQAQG